MATIAIFGGTGYAGGAIRDEALRRGHTVISISRKEADVAGTAGLIARAGDLHDPALVDHTAVEADVIVLDWRLPTISGIDLLPRLRELGVNLPVVFLTSHPLPANEQLAFELGALDFVDKTRGVELLAKRLRLAVGKPTPAAEKPIVCGKLVLSPSTSRAYWNGVDVGLTISEYDIVHFLASNVGTYETYRAIYDAQYYEGFVAGKGTQGYRTNVRSSIKRIRRKFCEVDSTFSEIQNSQTQGYRWRGLTRSY